MPTGREQHVILLYGSIAPYVRLYAKIGIKFYQVHFVINHLRIEGCFILTDKGYRCSRFSISPYFSNEVENGYTPQECKHYDDIHSSTRSSIERAIGLLKARVPTLSKGVYKKSISDAIDFVNAAIVFHQLCRYIETALRPSLDYVKHMKTHATDIPEYVTNDGKALRRIIVKEVSKMKL